jgi:NADH-quinone oxidoreductase subunit H
MLVIFRKVLYVFLIFGVNLYVCSFIANKISSRSELRRGFVTSRGGGLAFPFIKLLRYLSKDYRLNIWEFLLFFFSLFIWTIIPFSQTLIILKFDFDLILALLFYLLLIFINLINVSRSYYSFTFNNFTKKIVMVFTFFTPILFSASSLVLINRTLNLREIVGFQYQTWNIIYQPLGFIAVFASILMQLKLLGLTRQNSLLFSESIEKEGAGIGRLIIRISYYSIIFFLIVLTVIFYLSGWQNIKFVNGHILFAIKFYIIFLILILIDKATPKLNNYNYLVSINFKFLFPISAVNFLMTLIFFLLRNIYNLI